METRNQVLKCRCGTAGTFEYERSNEAFDDHVGFVSLSPGFTYRNDAEAKALTQFMCDNFFDVRTFGAVMSTGDTEPATRLDVGTNEISTIDAAASRFANARAENITIVLAMICMTFPRFEMLVWSRVAI